LRDALIAEKLMGCNRMTWMQLTGATNQTDLDPLDPNATNSPRQIHQAQIHHDKFTTPIDEP
jgi:hypothetical protein